ncbi:MAG: tRNA 4-thiouridine(8) synthase ThiI [Deltaproteobacteria bacterium]|nr:tRNA 4-thiouridine(8) synthase ThiI [Deltaproteobacteria bacterium]
MIPRDQPRKPDPVANDPATSSNASNAPAKTLLLLRFSGDLTTKADATRRRMTSRLVENLRMALKSSGRAGKVVKDRNRLFVALEKTDEPTLLDDDAMAERFARVFGIQSVSISHAIEYENVDHIVREGEAFGAPHVRDRKFAVRARRVGDRGETRISASKIERDLGSALLPLARGVDLKHPDTTVFVEVDPDQAYYFIANEPGAGGLPLGTEGRAVSLLSGGFDSPVASWRLLRRGVALDYVFCNLGGRQHELETLQIAKCLADRWQQGTRPRFHSVDFDPVSREIQAKVTTRYWQIILKRLMLRAAEAVAGRWEASAIVTGEAIGQVSSQTLQNLAVIETGAKLPVLRPLVGNNKEEIIAESRHVGTHDLSAKVGEYCAIVPSKPATHARLDDILEEEAKLDPSVLEQALEARTHYRLTDVDLSAWEAEDLAAREIGPNDTVIDLRPKAAYTTWHYPGALFLDFPNALRAYASFDSGQRYVLYCDFGLKSAHLADLMRREGLEARHVSGGLREVRRLAEAGGN